MQKTMNKKLVAHGLKYYKSPFFFRAYSRISLDAIITTNLVPWVLEKIFSLEIDENDICLGGYKQAYALFSKKCAPKKHIHAPSV